MARAFGVRCLHVYSDSQLIVNQVRGEYEARGEHIQLYQEIVKGLLEQFGQIYVEQIPRDSNSQADALTRLATSEGEAKLSNIIITNQALPSTTHFLVAQVDEIEGTWMQPIYTYLKTDEQPSDKTEASRLQRRAARYVILNDHLYKRGFSMPLLKCITTEQGQIVLGEIHGGLLGYFLS
ncbi:hypothetical protein ACS0TY_020294 [Phlomoides rotata]